MESEGRKNRKIFKWIKRILIFIILFCATSFVLILILTARRMQQQNEELDQLATKPITINGKVLGEVGASTGGFKSDNYQAPQITFGGEGLIFYPLNEEQLSITINNLKSEIFADKNKKDKKLLVSWDTPKQAKCSISYAKAGSSAEQTYQEGNYGYSHAALLTPLNSGTTYNYVVTARDKWGNEINSDKFAVYTGAQEVSLLDLLAAAFKSIFGWAMK